MPEVASPPDAPAINAPPDGRATWWWTGRLGIFTGADSLLTVATLVLATALLVYLPSAFGVDSWLALVAGRDIWQHGLPQRESLTVIAHGVRWVDQQWLSQLASYAIYRIGGLGLLGLFNVSLIVGTVAGAAAAARRLGASARTVMLMLPLCVFVILPAREVRTQEFVLPLFAATVYLLAADSRHPSRRVYWCLPILVLWANLHGTASLGAGLIFLRGVTIAWERRDRLTAARYWVRPALLMLGALLCVLITPYGFRVISYYHATLFNSALRHSVTEWQPITSVSWVAAPFLVLAAVTIWSFGRHPAQTTLWDRLALLGLATISVSVSRNAAFFGICALAIVPVSVEASSSSAGGRDIELRRRVNTLASVAALAALVIGIASTLVRPSRQFETSSQRFGLLTAVRHALTADPSLRLFTDSRSADWLLWRDPSLAGHLAADVRYELLTASQIGSVQATLNAIGPNWKRAARGYRLVVLDRQADRLSVAGFLQEPGRRVLYDDGARITILRSISASR